MKLVWLERDKGFVSYSSKYLVVFLADFDVTRAKYAEVFSDKGT